MEYHLRGPTQALWKSHKRKREKEVEGISKEIMAKNFPNTMKNIDLHAKAVHQTP